MIGRYVSDLEPGDVLEPVRYEVTAFIVREYCHGVEEVGDIFHGGGSEIQYAPPTMAHVDKVRVLQAACPGGAGPVPRIHYLYEATHHRAIRVGQTLSVGGRVVERYTRRGRDFLVISFEVRDALTDDLHTTYRDVSLLNHAAPGDERDQVSDG